MATDYTMTEMVESLKKRGLIPVAQKTFTSADLIRFMSEELMNYIVPKIMEVRENYFLEHYDQALVANQSRYNINPRAIGMKMKKLYWMNDEDEVQRDILQVDIEQISTLNWDNVGPNPLFFYYVDNYIEVIPTPSDGVLGSLRQFFFQRRNRLVQTSEAGRITDITGTNLTVNALPSSFTTSVEYDFVKGTPGFQNLEIDITPSGISGTVMTFDADDIPSALQVGDWICLAGESPIPQIPYDAFPLLAQQGVFVTLEALNDLTGSSKAEKKRDEMLTQIIRLVGIRTEDDPKTIVSGQNIGNYVFNGGVRGPWLR